MNHILIKFNLYKTQFYFLSNEKKIYCFDLDNTLCVSKNGNYSKSKPKKKLLKF